jgi:hypothetical protein
MEAPAPCVTKVTNGLARRTYFSPMTIHNKAFAFILACLLCIGIIGAAVLLVDIIL